MTNIKICPEISFVRCNPSVEPQKPIGRINIPDVGTFDEMLKTRKKD